MLVAPQLACIDPSNLHLVGKCDYLSVVTIIGDVPYYRLQVVSTDKLLSGGITTARVGECTANKTSTSPPSMAPTLAKYSIPGFNLKFGGRRSS